MANDLDPEKPAAAKLTGTEKGEREKYAFLEALAECTQDPIELRDQVLQLLVAGTDTAAVVLALTFASLAKHPEAWRKLRAEVLDKFGAEDDENEITFSKLKWLSISSARSE